MSKIPKILHFCFGLDRYFGGKPWSLVHFVCVKSAIERIKPTQAFIYYEHEPSGPWWQLSRRMLTPIPIQAPRAIFGNALRHPAHRADVVRLEALIRHGGIYLDADVLVHESFDPLLGNSVVLGAEGINNEGGGLGNAVILAEPGAPFLRRWHEEYRWFRSKGGDQYWCEHSVFVPHTLSKSHPDEITILPHTAFFWPPCTTEHLELIYGSDESNSPAERGLLANHLWETAAWKKHLRDLTPGKVRAVESNFHRWARPYVADLPDDYGRPTLAEGVGRFVERQKWYVASRLAKLT